MRDWWTFVWGVAWRAAVLYLGAGVFVLAVHALVGGG